MAFTPISRDQMRARGQKAAVNYKPVDPKALSEPQARRRAIRNVTVMARSAPASTVEAGRSWYGRANDIATAAGRRMGAQGGDPTPTGAGVVAALSPSMSWDDNISATHQFAGLPEHHVNAMAEANEVQKVYAAQIAHHEGVAAQAAGLPRGKRVKGAAPAHLYEMHALARHDHAVARAVLEGTPLNKQSTDNIVKAHRVRRGEAPEAVLPQQLKTGHFYRNVKDPSDPEPVTVDTHAHDIAHGVKLPYATDRGLQGVGRYNAHADVYRAASRLLGHETPGVTQAVTWSHWRSLYGQQTQPPHDPGQWESWHPGVEQHYEAPEGADLGRAEAVNAAIQRSRSQSTVGRAQRKRLMEVRRSKEATLADYGVVVKDEW